MLRALAPWPRETVRTELLDQPVAAPGELAECLRDIALINRLGPIRTLLVYLAPFLEAHRGPDPLTVLDLGTGNADIPVALVRWARRHGHRVRVLGIDRSPEVVACAAETVAAFPEVRLVAGEALAPPVRPGGADVVICSLMLHHLPEDAVVGLLRTMGSMARLGFVVSDLRRSRAAWGAAWLLTRLVSRNRLTRHDGPLSVERAYTRRELGALSVAAGLTGVRWQHAIAFRLVGVYRHPPASTP